MVKKLLKHEFVYYFRTFGMLLPIVLVIGVMARVFRLFDDGNALNAGNVLTEIAIFSSNALLVVACAALILLSVIVSVVRFYKNMYSSEGYLTFALPITPRQHIFVKLLAALVCQAACVLTVAIAGAIALAGDAFLDVYGLLATGIAELFSLCGTANAIVFITEALLLILISSASNMLLYYGCITVGQTAKKNRIFMAVGAYFIYYVATQVISTIFSMVVMLMGMSGAFDFVVTWVEDHALLSAHLFLGLAPIISAVICAAFWLVTETIMRKKLNLE